MWGLFKVIGALYSVYFPTYHPLFRLRRAKNPMKCMGTCGGNRPLPPWKNNSREGEVLMENFCKTIQNIFFFTKIQIQIMEILFRKISFVFVYIWGNKKGWTFWRSIMFFLSWRRIWSFQTCSWEVNIYFKILWSFFFSFTFKKPENDFLWVVIDKLLTLY